MGIPHVCGDEPATRDELKRQMKYAPRMWG